MLLKEYILFIVVYIIFLHTFILAVFIFVSWRYNRDYLYASMDILF